MVVEILHTSSADQAMLSVFILQGIALKTNLMKFMSLYQITQSIFGKGLLVVSGSVQRYEEIEKKIYHI